MTSGSFKPCGWADGKVNTTSDNDEIWVSLMSQFKKRDVERKGGKKQENLSKKLIEENLDDLRNISETEE
jgi:hypothetical protein